jgi:hypothetical protein
MRNKFKFFRGYVGTLDIMDGQTYATASLYYPRLDSNNEMERYYAEHFQNISQEQYNLNRDMLIEQERIRRLGMINHSIETNEQIRLFQATTTITLNPTLWTKVKIFGKKVKLVLIHTWKSEPIAVIYVSVLATFVTILSIAKILSIW